MLQSYIRSCAKKKKKPNAVPTKPKGERSVNISGWDTVAQSMCCTWAPFDRTLCSYFYRQPKLTPMLACVQILAILWQTILMLTLETPCLCRTSVGGRCCKGGWDRWFCWNRSWAPGLCPSQETAPVDRSRRGHLHFILQEYQVITQEHLRSVGRQQIYIQVAPAEQHWQSWRNEVTCSGSSS